LEPKNLSRIREQGEKMNPAKERQWLKSERGAEYFLTTSQIKGRQVKVYHSTIEGRKRRTKNKRKTP